MNGILVVNKERDMTSRDVVNIATKTLNTKKIGHTGTLDPIAEGVLVLTVGKYTRLGEMLTALDKEYIVTVKLGISTDTFDITGNIISEVNNYELTKKRLVEVLNGFKKTYLQTVPIYSAVKVNGKKLYEYARANEEVELPQKEVTIKSIELLSFNEEEFVFKTKVTKGTYIRSLINDISEIIDIPCTMSGLKRTEQGIFKLDEDTNTIIDLKENNLKWYDIDDLFKEQKEQITDEILLKKVMNGAVLDNVHNKEFVAYFYEQELIAIYKKDRDKLKAYKVFN